MDEPRIHSHGPVTIHVRPGRSLSATLLSALELPLRLAAVVEAELVVLRGEGVGLGGRVWIRREGRTR